MSAGKYIVSCYAEKVSARQVQTGLFFFFFPQLSASSESAATKAASNKLPAHRSVYMYVVRYNSGSFRHCYNGRRCRRLAELRCSGGGVCCSTLSRTRPINHRPNAH